VAAPKSKREDIISAFHKLTKGDRHVFGVNWSLISLYIPSTSSLL